MAETTGSADQQNEAASNEQKFAIQRVYIKDLSFEAPMGVSAFNQAWKPQVNQEINTKNQKLNDSTYEVVLSLTITVKIDDNVVFLIEIQQAGIFFVEGLEANQLTQVLNTVCLQILFPYARESVDNAVVKGGFPPLMLPPVNFDALFANAIAQANAKAEKAEENKSIN